MGISLPGCGTSLAVSAKKKRIAFESGEKIVELVKKGITVRKILIKNALENAIYVDMAIGGSTNTVLHLTAIANEAEIELMILSISILRLRIFAPFSLRVTILWRTWNMPAEYLL